MYTLIGILFGMACTAAGYLLHGGHMMVFVEAWTEFVVIIGAGIGIFIGSNGLPIVKRSIADMFKLLKPNASGKKEYVELLLMLYKIFSLSRAEGLLALEGHIEDPHKSNILSANHGFIHNHHATDFFCDTMKVLVTGGVQPHDLSEMMEQDLDTMHGEETQVPDALQNMADALPAVGIVACVLGVIITMGHIGGEAAEIGHAIGGALVGTLLGVLIAYVVANPIVRALILKVRADGQYLNCIRKAIESSARGESPVNSVEFARRNIDPSLRPSFSEMAAVIKERGRNK